MRLLLDHDKDKIKPLPNFAFEQKKKFTVQTKYQPSSFLAKWLPPLYQLQLYPGSNFPSA
jgi:hypothetical protein